MMAFLCMGLESWPFEPYRDDDALATPEIFPAALRWDRLGPDVTPPSLGKMFHSRTHGVATLRSRCPARRELAGTTDRASTQRDGRSGSSCEAALLALRGMVLTRRHSGNRDSLLPHTSAAQAPRTLPGPRGRGGIPGRMPSASSSRSRPCGPSRLSTSSAKALAGGLRLSAEPYPDYYRPNPGSRRYVEHLPYWYAPKPSR